MTVGSWKTENISKQDICRLLNIRSLPEGVQKTVDQWGKIKQNDKVTEIYFNGVLIFTKKLSVEKSNRKVKTEEILKIFQEANKINNDMFKPVGEATFIQWVNPHHSLFKTPGIILDPEFAYCGFSACFDGPDLVHCKITPSLSKNDFDKGGAFWVKPDGSFTSSDPDYEKKKK